MDAHRSSRGNAVLGSMVVVFYCALWATTTMTMHGVSAFGSTGSSSNKNRIIFSSVQRQNHPTLATRISLFNRNQEASSPPPPQPVELWSKPTRQVMAKLASFGAAETLYLTYSKLTNQAVICNSESTGTLSCDSVLNGPYAHLPFVEGIPLAALGFVAYSAVAGLCLWPLVAGGENNENDFDDTQNRVLLTALTSAMGTFSAFLMVLLYGVLHQSCNYCLASAVFSGILALTALTGGCLPGMEDEETSIAETSGGKTVAMGVAGAVLGSVLLLGAGSVDAISAPGGSATVLATTISGGNSQQPQQQQLYAPPEITTDSSKRALKIAESLNQMDAKMYGAHWCSHCYDQKQAFGKQVFDKQKPLVAYVECSKDGINSESKVCKAKEIPGYPTWEIKGQLYPGEKDLEELEELIKDIASNKI